MTSIKKFLLLVWAWLKSLVTRVCNEERKAVAETVEVGRKCASCGNQVELWVSREGSPTQCHKCAGI
jgi:hypothetical protein